MYKPNVVVIFSTDRDIRRCECGGGEATSPRPVVHELTLERLAT